ncbi:unnamed protein product [Moneuplotes crassus]|uniref:Uncharacterized protein n=1 Tax=Euplotes crassus TaxID=5936 RepID=A0AAD2D6J8_EUPCR|nr:unnamed protein product [Moneuplotes crassus]
MYNIFKTTINMKMTSMIMEAATEVSKFEWGHNPSPCGSLTDFVTRNYLDDIQIEDQAKDIKLVMPSF